MAAQSIYAVAATLESLQLQYDLATIHKLQDPSEENINRFEVLSLRVKEAERDLAAFPLDLQVALLERLRDKSEEAQRQVGYQTERIYTFTLEQHLEYLEQLRSQLKAMDKKDHFAHNTLTTQIYEEELRIRKMQEWQVSQLQRNSERK